MDILKFVLKAHEMRKGTTFCIISCGRLELCNSEFLYEDGVKNVCLGIWYSKDEYVPNMFFFGARLLPKKFHYPKILEKYFCLEIIDTTNVYYMQSNIFK